MKISKSNLVNGLILIITIAITIFIADFIVKKLDLPKRNSFVMLLSGSKLYTDQHLVRRYETNKNAEQSLLAYGEIAYRYQFKTNNLGLVSKYDYDFEKPLDLMIVGDSVSEGQEVGPWLDVVQEKIWKDHQKTSQNFAILGNGFINFERAASYAKNILGAKKALLIFIADDMFRQGAIMYANEECSAYKTIKDKGYVDCFSGNFTIHHYNSNLSNSELEKFAKSKQRLGLYQVIHPTYVRNALKVVRFMCSGGIRLNFNWWVAKRFNYECEAQIQINKVAQIKTVKKIKTKYSEIPDYSINALEKILNVYGTENVLLVRIPGGGVSMKESKLRKNFNDQLGINYKLPIQYTDLSDTCPMPREFWAPLPGSGPMRGFGHPTKEGYLKLQSCILQNDLVMKFMTE